MSTVPATKLASLIALGAAMSVTGCVTDEQLDADLDSEGTENEQDTGAASSSCTTGPGTYSPFTLSGSPIGDVAIYPWRGVSRTYPSGNEDFRGYTSGSLVECAEDKRRRDYLDVTAGCLDAVATGGGAYLRGQVTTTGDGAFRAIALGHDGSAAPVKWEDQAIEYRFFYHSQQSAGTNPGFKAFIRYRSENDLYVASWRLDGVVQIQRKQCGLYTALAVRRDLGPPSRDSWHTIRFEAVGDRLALYLDRELALTATSSTFAWGTAGIRIDAMDGAYLDDWRVSAP